jgi:DNA-binding MarR family transcriptional regulator
MNEETVLAAIGYSEETTFGEFCTALAGDCPENREEWRDLFSLLQGLERRGFVEIDKLNGRIDTLTLTDAGASRVRQKSVRKHQIED